MVSTNKQDYNWLQKHRNNRFTIGKPNVYAVEEFLPPNVFTHFLKIYMPFFIDNQINIEKSNKDIWVDFKTDEMQPISAKNLAYKFGFKFDVEFGVAKIYGKYRHIPKGLFLCRDETIYYLRQFISLLPNGEKCYFVGDTDDGKFDIKEEGFEKWFEIGGINNLIEYFKILPYYFPSYIWNEERNWCIFSPEEIEDYLILGCNEFTFNNIVSSNLDIIILGYKDKFYSL